MGNESTVPVQRGPKGNKVQPGLRIILMERLYPGSPRWNTQTEEEHTHKLFPGGSDDPNREPAVVEAIEEAWGKASLGGGRYSADANGSSSQQLCARSDLRIQTCVDPNCSRRSQEKYDPSVSFHLDQCAKCGKPTRYDYLRCIRHKWIYVFRGEPGGAIFEDEIFAQDENNWLIWNRPGVVPRSDRDFIANQQDLPVGNQYYTIEPGKLYQFFLSPVQLSKNALKDLNDAANKKPQSPPKNAVIDRNPNAEQLDSITVRRKFFAPEVTDAGSRTEIVGVMDAWSWLEEVNDWDYRPIIEAQLQFLMNPNEGTKLNIAVILNNLVAPAGGGKRDQFNLSRDMSDGCEKLESKTRAEAWVKQYEKTKTFLATEAEKACMRLNEWRTSRGHQIIETACQEELDMPGLQFPFTSPLAWGIAHYANILRDVMGCPFGEAILTGLATHEIERLPYRYVLYPGAAEQQEVRRVRQDIGDLSLNILALFSPLIIRLAEENREAEVFVGHLKKLGVTATVPAKVTKGPDTYDVYKPIKVIKDSIIKVKEERLAAAAKLLLPPPKPVDAPKTYYDKLKLYSTWETRMTDLVDLWIASKACDAENPYETNVDRVRTAKSKVQYVTKLASFTNKQTKALFSYYAQRHFKFDVGKWCEKYGHPTKEVGTIDIRALEASEGSSSVIISKETVELVEKSSVKRFGAMVRLYRGLEVGAKFLSGPVALLFGGMDLIFQARDMVDNWQNGNYWACAGMGAIYVGSIIAMACSVVETAGLFGAAWATPYLTAMGPWGLVAAVLILLGSLTIWIFSKSDLEMFAMHSFLGDKYGTGSFLSSSGPQWAEGTKYPSWAQGADRYSRQLLYMVNLMSQYYVLLRPNENMSLPGVDYGAFVKPGFLPPSAKCEVVVVGHYQDFMGKSMDLTATALIDMGSGQYIVEGDQLEQHYVESVPRNTWGTDKLNHFKVKMKHLLKDGMKATGLFTVKVRFDVLGQGFRPNVKYLEYSNRELNGFDGMRGSLE